MLRQALLLSILCLACTPALGEKGRDPLLGAPRGNLKIHMTISADGRSPTINAGEFTTLRVDRVADMELLMVLLGEAQGPMVPIRGHDLTNPEMPDEKRKLFDAVADCEGDTACENAVFLRFAGINEIPDNLGENSWEFRGYENWVSDAESEMGCVTGTLSVADSGSGMAAHPPAPPAPFSYERNGTVDLAAVSDKVLGEICDTWFSYDTNREVVSIRMPLDGMRVMTNLSGGFDGEQEVELIADAEDYLFELDVSTGWMYGMLSGAFERHNVGYASVNGGQVRVPLTVNVTWQFRPEWM